MKIERPRTEEPNHQERDHRNPPTYSPVLNPFQTFFETAEKTNIGEQSVEPIPALVVVLIVVVAYQLQLALKPQILLGYEVRELRELSE